MWLLSRVALAGCIEDGTDALVEHARAMEAAYDALDEEAFAFRYEALAQAATCVRSELSYEALVAWHRARALGEFFEREFAASAKSWAAVKVLDPAYVPPDAWLVPGTPLERAWREAPMDATRVVLERAPEGGWRVDGQATHGVPTERGFILQGFDASGALVHSDYHYSVAEVPMVDFEALDPTARQRRQRRMRVLGTVTAVVLGAGALTTGTIASVDELTLKGDSLPLEKIQGRAQRANVLYGTAGGLAGGAALAAGAGWLVRW